MTAKIAEVVLMHDEHKTTFDLWPDAIGANESETILEQGPTASLTLYGYGAHGAQQGAYRIGSDLSELPLIAARAVTFLLSIS